MQDYTEGTRCADIAQRAPQKREEIIVRTSVPLSNGLHLEWSNVNQAWFVMWYSQVFGVYNTLPEARAYAEDLLR